MKNLSYLVSLHRVNGLGPKRLKMLLDIYQDPKIVWQLNQSDFNQLKLGAVYKELDQTRKEIDPNQYLDSIYKRGIQIKTIFDADYPKLLSQIYDPPIIIYFLGNLIHLPTHIGVVGTRNITSYGKLVTEKFSLGLAKAGLIIVSGLARGVDTIAHRSTVEVKGKTIAVLGGGLSHIFPAENINLADQIVEMGGAVISEFPPDFPSLPGNFPSRNRIISGLSKAVLVTEAAQDSGSLITARQALDQGREVFAVPGPITSSVSIGALELIKQGAQLVVDPSEILETLGIDNLILESSQLTDQRLETLSEFDRVILELLENEPKHLDEICRLLSKPTPQISASLIKMEIQGFVKNMGLGNYIKAI